MTQSVPGYVEHHFSQFYKEGHPVVLCTDDTGVFGTSLSKEWALAASSFNLSETELIDLAEKSYGYIFGGSQVAATLRQRLESFKAVWQAGIMPEK